VQDLAGTVVGVVEQAEQQMLATQVVVGEVDRGLEVTPIGIRAGKVRPDHS